MEDGLVLDKKRKLNVWAVDFNTTIPFTRTRIITEWAWVLVDIPETYSQQYGEKQFGGFIDFVQPVFNRNIFGFERSVVSLALRAEYVDWNVGKFNETGTKIRDDIAAVSPGISWRPTQQTVIRFNYKHSWQTDLLGNRPSKTGGFQLGLASYF